MKPKIKIEDWNNNNIRFVDVDGEWWAVLKDITDALELKTFDIKRRLDDDMVSNHTIIDRLNREQEMLIINEFGIYETIFSSRKPEAKDFKRWVFGVIKELRKSSGLEGFQIFRMLDKEHQKEQMKKLSQALKNPVRIDFMKANTISNKAISNKYGYPKMIKKGDMNSEMLADREQVLEDVVELMSVKDKYNLNVSVSEAIYEKVR